jgi:hypothetical protein
MSAQQIASTMGTGNGFDFPYNSHADGFSILTAFEKNGSGASWASMSSMAQYGSQWGASRAIAQALPE